MGTATEAAGNDAGTTTRLAAKVALVGVHEGDVADVEQLAGRVDRPQLAGEAQRRAGAHDGGGGAEARPGAPRAQA